MFFENAPLGGVPLFAEALAGKKLAQDFIPKLLGRSLGNRNIFALCGGDKAKDFGKTDGERNGSVRKARKDVRAELEHFVPQGSGLAVERFRFFGRFRFFKAQGSVGREEKPRGLFTTKPQALFLDIAENFHKTRMFPANIRKGVLAQIPMDFAQIIFVEERTAFLFRENEMPVRNALAEFFSERSRNLFVAGKRFFVNIHFPARATGVGAGSGRTPELFVKIGNDPFHGNFLPERFSARMFWGSTFLCHSIHWS